MTGRFARLPGHDGAVELLDRSLAYTRVPLAAVTDDRLTLTTPCAGWDLAGLLAHMGDALDAFGEAATGAVRLTTTTPAAVRVEALQQKACALLGTWSAAVPTSVHIGEEAMDSSVLALTAALEITVHGWDVARSLGLDHPVPEELAARLLPVALALVAPEDRGSRFADPATPEVSSSAATLLLGYLGRSMTGPPRAVCAKRGAGPRIAS